MKGGVVFFRGAGSAARAYLESDHSHADDYYLEHGQAEAQWDARGSDLDAHATDTLSGEQYQAWVDWDDPHTGESRGTPREEARISTKTGEVVTRPSSPRFAEMNVNCDKSLSVAAALDARVSEALDQAQAAAVEAMREYLAAESVTRVGPKGAQRYVSVERIESVAVVHRTSRAGDPHRHVHLQWNARVFADGKWRGLYTAGMLAQQAALRGVAEAAINSHGGLREALRVAGFDFDAESGKVRNLADQAALLSKRSAQVSAGKAARESAWRRENPGLEPSRAQLNEWDFEAWADGRPQKAEFSERNEAAWIAEIRAAGLQTSGFAVPDKTSQLSLSELNPNEIAHRAVSVCESRGSAWSKSTLAGRIAEQISRLDVIATPHDIVTYSTRLAADIAAGSPVIDPDLMGQDLPDFVPYFTSDRVVSVERELKSVLIERGLASGLTVDGVAASAEFGISGRQGRAAEALASAAPLVVVEGAAGSGKTTMMRAAREIAEREGRSLLIVAPTLRAAQEAGNAVGAQASSAHRLAYEYGFRWDGNGSWTRLNVGDIDPVTGVRYEGAKEGFEVTAASRIVVDEAGMLDQDVAHALVSIAEENGAPIAFIGDRAQLAAVGRGGVLDFAVAASPSPIDLTEVHRFVDPEYAAITLRMREREEPRAVFSDLYERGNIRVHATEQEMHDAIVSDAVRRARTGSTVAVSAATNEQAQQLNALIQQAHAERGGTQETRVSVTGADHLVLRRGDKIMTRQNDVALGVANRDIWTVQSVRRNGSVVAAGVNGQTVILPLEYVQEHTHLAYASTEYGVQGATVSSGHGIVTDTSSAQGVYVAATRGREVNTLHIVAETPQAAAEVFVGAMLNESGDRGLAPAIDRAHRHLEGIVTATPSSPEINDPEIRAAREDHELHRFEGQLARFEESARAWEQRHPGLPAEQYGVALRELEAEVASATTIVTTTEHNLARQAEGHYRAEWTTDYGKVAQAHSTAESAGVFARSRANESLDQTRREFLSKHNAPPAPTPPQTRIEQVRRTAIEPGANAELDGARTHAHRAALQHDAMRKDPPPLRPASPTRGTPAQENAKDAAFKAKARAAENSRANTGARAYVPPAVPRTPGLER